MPKTDWPSPWQSLSRLGEYNTRPGKVRYLGAAGLKACGSRARPVWPPTIRRSSAGMSDSIKARRFALTVAFKADAGTPFAIPVQSLGTRNFGQDTLIVELKGILGEHNQAKIQPKTLSGSDIDRPIDIQEANATLRMPTIFYPSAKPDHICCIIPSILAEKQGEYALVELGYTKAKDPDNPQAIMGMPDDCESDSYAEEIRIRNEALGIRSNEYSYMLSCLLNGVEDTNNRFWDDAAGAIRQFVPENEPLSCEPVFVPLDTGPGFRGVFNSLDILGSGRQELLEADAMQTIIKNPSGAELAWLSRAQNDRESDPMALMLADITEAKGITRDDRIAATYAFCKLVASDAQTVTIDRPEMARLWGYSKKGGAGATRRQAEALMLCLDKSTDFLSRLAVEVNIENKGGTPIRGRGPLFHKDARLWENVLPGCPVSGAPDRIVLRVSGLTEATREMRKDYRYLIGAFNSVVELGTYNGGNFAKSIILELWQIGRLNAKKNGNVVKSTPGRILRDGTWKVDKLPDISKHGQRIRSDFHAGMELLEERKLIEPGWHVGEARGAAWWDVSVCATLAGDVAQALKSVQSKSATAPQAMRGGRRGPKGR